MFDNAIAYNGLPGTGKTTELIKLITNKDIVVVVMTSAAKNAIVSKIAPVYAS